MYYAYIYIYVCIYTPAPEIDTFVASTPSAFEGHVLSFYKLLHVSIMPLEASAMPLYSLLTGQRQRDRDTGQGQGERDTG